MYNVTLSTVVARLPSVERYLMHQRALYTIIHSGKMGL